VRRKLFIVIGIAFLATWIASAVVFLLLAPNPLSFEALPGDTDVPFQRDRAVQDALLVGVGGTLMCLVLAGSVVLLVRK